MNTTAAEAVTLTGRVRQLAERIDDVDIVLLPPVIWLPTLAEALHHRPRTLALGVQNFYPKEEGAYTGEVSAAMIRGLASYVLVGHSERRHLFGETDELINDKVAAALRAGLSPILAVGETAQKSQIPNPKFQRNRETPLGQLGAALDGVRERHLERLVVCYEPRWAIGTGRNVAGQEAEATLAALRERLASRFGRHAADRIRTIYGGSVNTDTIDEYMRQPNIDGVLVGGASLDFRQFSAITAAVAERVHHVRQHPDH